MKEGGCDSLKCTVRMELSIANLLHKENPGLDRVRQHQNDPSSMYYCLHIPGRGRRANRKRFLTDDDIGEGKPERGRRRRGQRISFEERGFVIPFSTLITCPRSIISLAWEEGEKERENMKM